MDERYLSSQLLTPKSSMAEKEGSSRESLLGSREFCNVKSMYESSSKTFDDIAKVAERVAGIVRNTIDFRATSHSSSPLNADNIAKDEVANCYGHTIVASECLEELGIEHFISYANQHTFITLFDRDSNRSFMVDILTKELCCEITDAIGFGNKDPVEQLNCGELRAKSTLYTDVLLQKLPPSINKSDFVAQREWLMFSDGWDYRDGFGTKAMLQMLTLPSVPGRLLLLDEYNARIDQLNGRYEEAAGRIGDLSGIYLDIDPRNNLAEVSKLCKSLINQGSTDLAIEVAIVVNDSLLPEDYSKNRLFLPDIMRKVARQKNDKSILEESIHLYEEIINSKPRYDSLATGKLIAANKLLKSMKDATPF